MRVRVRVRVSVSVSVSVRVRVRVRVRARARVRVRVTVTITVRVRVTVTVTVRVRVDEHLAAVAPTDAVVERHVLAPVSKRKAREGWGEGNDVAERSRVPMSADGRRGQAGLVLSLRVRVRGDTEGVRGCGGMGRSPPRRCFRLRGWIAPLFRQGARAAALIGCFAAPPACIAPG